MEFILIAELVAFVSAYGLTVVFRRPRSVLAFGALLGLSVSVLAAAVDPDGPPDPDAFLDLNASSGEWFVLGIAATVVLYVGWALGVLLGRTANRRPT